MISLSTQPKKCLHNSSYDVGKADIYINDTIAISLGINENLNRINNAIPFVIHTLACLINLSDLFPGKDIFLLRNS
jgi:hypothetical protein